jgi:hypothetical protein
MSKVFKKPSLLARQFGVDNEGRNGASVFVAELFSAASKDYNLEKAITIPIVSAIAGGVIFSISQWIEADFVNVRPDLPESIYMQTDAADNISAVTILSDHDYEPTSWSNVNTEKTYLLIETDGTYEISSCSGTICTPLSADDVRELRGEMRVMAEEEEIAYLDPAFFFPSQIESLTPLMQMQDSIGFFTEERFIEGEPRRELNAASYSVDGKFQRLNSAYMSFDVEGTVNLWTEALNSPDNGTYQVRDGAEDLYTWPRTSNGQWEDLPTSENPFYTMAGIFLLAHAGMGAAQIGAARRQTKSKVKKLKGLDLLKP